MRTQVMARIGNPRRPRHETRVTKVTYASSVACKALIVGLRSPIPRHPSKGLHDGPGLPSGAIPFRFDSFPGSSY
jgi:hypothetical protein